MPTQITRAVYVDAAVLNSDESLFDLLKQADFDMLSIIDDKPKA